MDIKIMSPKKEQEVFEAMKEAIEYTNQGISPDDAIVKAASTHAFEPDVVRRMVEAFNRSKTIALFSKEGFDRTNEFSIADANHVLSKMFPEKIKSADERIPQEYNSPEKEDFFKASVRTEHRKCEAALPSLDFVIKTAHEQRQSDLQMLDLARTEAALDKEASRRALVSIARYFRHPGHRSFADVRTDAERIHGEMGKKAMDIVQAMLEPLPAEDMEKSQSISNIVNEQQEPLPLVKRAVDRVMDHAASLETIERMTSEINKFWKDAKERIAQLYSSQDNSGDDDFLIKPGEMSKEAQPPGINPQALQQVRNALGAPQPLAVASTTQKQPQKTPDQIEEEAYRKARGVERARQEMGTEKGKEKEEKGFFRSVGEKAVGPASRAKPKETVKHVEKIVPETITADEMLGLIEPEYKKEIDNIEITTMLSDLMANDPIISQADNETVVTAYERLATLAPRASRDPLIVRHMLRKIVNQGDVDLFDINTLTKIETELKKRDAIQPSALIA